MVLIFLDLSHKLSSYYNNKYSYTSALSSSFQKINIVYIFINNNSEKFVSILQKGLLILIDGCLDNGNLLATIFLIDRHHSYRWAAVVPWLNYLILAIDLWGPSAHYQVKCAVNLLLICLPCFTFIMLHPMFSIIVCLYSLYNTLLPQSLLSKAFDSKQRGKMEQIVSAYGFLKETATIIMLLYKKMKAMVNSPNCDINFFDIVTGVLQGNK